MAVSANKNDYMNKQIPDNTDTGLYLKYGRRPAGSNDKVQAVLWPVWIHKVLYPEVQQPKMNLYQKVVMRLIRAKTHDAEDIAQLTGMHINLVKLIQAELYSRGWINALATTLTEDGVNVINEADQQSELLASGYLFQDAYTGRLWPRIEKRLNILEPVDPTTVHPEFRQDRKTGRTFKPFKPSATLRRSSQPDARAASKAWQDYRSDYRYARQLYSSCQIPEQISLSGIRIQDVQPELAWIVVWITPGNADNLWSIKDPFNIRDEAWWLTNNLSQLLESDHNLLKRLGQLIDQPEPENQTVSEWLNSLQQQAQIQVMLECPWANNEPDIAAAISILLTRKKTISDGQKYQNDLEAAITESQKLLEVLMQWLIKTYPANTGSIPKSGKTDSKLHKQLLLALGLPAMTEDVADTLSRQSLQGVIRSLSMPTSSLKALFFAAALGSVGNPEHPLKSLDAQQLQLERLLKLADLRNQASHGNSRFTGKQYQEITEAHALEQIAYALSFTEHFKEWIHG
ncbi:MAG: hypothetical protein COB09_07900 [Thalassobium sp.]|nr:MAG: hypothetical protein COB09_07900 [Thalassobium sp.]